ncbi:hypothetical protein ACP4OV_021461 [Aristida adscensionis]
MARRRKRRLSSDTSPEPVIDQRGWPAKGVFEHGFIFYDQYKLSLSMMNGVARFLMNTTLDHKCYKMNFLETFGFKIDGAQLLQIPSKYDYGAFVIEFLQTYNGTFVPPFSNADLNDLRSRFLIQLLTSKYNEVKSEILNCFYN